MGRRRWCRGPSEICNTLGDQDHTQASCTHTLLALVGQLSLQVHIPSLCAHTFPVQGILSSFFFKFADTILKKYSSTIATIFTAVMSYAMFGHELSINFVIGVSIVLISMHQVCWGEGMNLVDEAYPPFISSP